MNYNFIAIEGNIGSGKTSLAEKIADSNKARLVLEQFAENPFLPRFYQDPVKYAFPLELSFLAERYNQVKSELNTGDLFNPMIISDYLISKCLVFAKINLQPDEYDLYSRLFTIIYPTLPKPDLLVYLYLPAEHLLANIQKRGRLYEKEISADYLNQIQDGYLNFLKQQQDLRIVVIDSSGLDFVNNYTDYTKLNEIIFRDHPMGISRFIP